MWDDALPRSGTDARPLTTEITRGDASTRLWCWHSSRESWMLQANCEGAVRVAQVPSGNRRSQTAGSAPAGLNSAGACEIGGL